MSGNAAFSEAKGRFGFGFMRLPMIPDRNEVDWEQTCRMVDCFLDAGFNYFDTAHVYLGGQSEEAIRKCLAERYPRERFLLADKLSASCFQTEEDIRPFVKKELELCGVTYFDYYLMHAQDAGRFEKYRSCRAYETAMEMREEGLLRHVGLSFHDSAAVLDRILTAYPGLDFVQLQFNYLDYEDGVVQSRACYDVCRRHGKPVVVMEPVKGGRLANLSPEERAALDRLGTESSVSYALRFAASFEGIEMILSGMSDLAQTQENVRIMKDCRALEKEELSALREICRIAAGKDHIECTGCRYCTDGCPAGIRIPDLFACQNSHYNGNGWTSRKQYGAVTEKGGKASECIRCGQCEEACPQHLPIRDLLETVSATFEQ